ncbi:MAG: hypothetical protein LBM98_06105 [Oscillospiraceae bacterium]|jgi:3D (Asp-Asp-Asp) domain-containing protein|nr:hypothetical protein [Oscillospiraceae bacterium]
MRHIFISPILLLAAIFAFNAGAEFAASVTDSAEPVSQPYADVYDIDPIQAHETAPPQAFYYGAAPEYFPGDYPEAFAEIAPTLFFNGVIPEAEPSPEVKPSPQKQSKPNEYLKTQTAMLAGELDGLQIIDTLNVSATAYTTERQRNKTTATGTTARVGAIAVDPKVIPYGTKLYIAAPDNSWIYGYATAEDCGGGIKKNKIDLFFDTYDECIAFGVKKAVVYVLGE